VYYFYAYFRVHDQLKHSGEDTDVPLHFSVPTGNFGDILAGYYAKQMGLPISLIAATNENDIIHRFFDLGEYHREDKTVPTFSPAMDIQVASNFERYLFYLSGGNPERVAEWMDLFNKSGKLTVTGSTLAHAKSEIKSYKVTHKDMISTIQHMHHQYNYVVDPHTAIGICAARNTSKNERARVVCLSTAHPAKFMETVQNAIGESLDSNKVIESAPGLAALLKGTAPTRSAEANATIAEVASFIKASTKHK